MSARRVRARKEEKTMYKQHIQGTESMIYSEGLGEIEAAAMEARRQVREPGSRGQHNVLVVRHCKECGGDMYGDPLTQRSWVDYHSDCR